MARHFSSPGGYSAWEGSRLPVAGLPVITITDRNVQEGKDPVSGETVAGVRVLFQFPLLGNMTAWVPLEQWPEGEANAVLAVYQAALASWRARARATWGRAVQIPDLLPKFP